MSYQIYDIKGLAQSYGEHKVFSDVTFDVNRKDRIAIIADNGVGKTTLLKCLLGIEELDAGEIKTADGLKIGYLSQAFENLPQNKKIFDFILEDNEHISDYGLVGLASKFGFSYDLKSKKIKDLSGGEKQRLQMVKLIMSKTNVLVFDEPTNHLDLELRRSLENALVNYPGVILFVSHDRYFIDKVANSILFLAIDGVKKRDGNFSMNVG